jgi:hypothetical protein
MATHFKNAKNDFFKLVNDIQNPGQDKKSDSHGSKGFSGDYCGTGDLCNIENSFFSIQRKSFQYAENLPVIPYAADEHPPEQVA